MLNYICIWLVTITIFILSNYILSFALYSTFKYKFINYLLFIIYGLAIILTATFILYQIFIGKYLI